MKKIPSLPIELREAFNRLVNQQTGLVIREQDRNSFYEKIFVRVKALGLSRPEDYYELLESKTVPSYKEWDKLINLLTNNESYFFRDKEQLKVLQNFIFPELIQQKQQSKTIRICSAGCSTGQEPYSLAIMLREMIPNLAQWKLLILGVDIDIQALQEAQKGMYESWSFRGVEETIKRKYFQKINNQYHLNSEIKQMVKFQRVNLVTDMFPQSDSELREMDLMICRNVFIYFQASTIGKVLTKIYQTLQPSGYFITGHTELSEQNLSSFDKLIFTESLVYQRPSTNKPKELEKSQQTKNLKQSIDIHQKLTTNLNKFEIKPSIDRISYPTISQNSTEFKQSLSSPDSSKIQKSEQSSKQSSESEVIQEIERLLSQERYSLAIDIAEKALKNYPNCHRLYHFLGQLYGNLGNYEEAINYCQQGIKLDPLQIEPYYLLAQITEEQGNLTAAKQTLKRIIYLDPKAIQAYLDLSHIYQKEGDEKRMSKMYQSAIDLLKQIPADKLTPRLQSLKINLES